MPVNPDAATVDSQSPTGQRSMANRATKADVQSWLRQETPEHLKLVTKLRERCAATIETDINEDGTPSRDWCRAYQRYAGTFQFLTTEERERVKLMLLARKAGDDMLSDEEYAKEMESLARESLGTLPVDALHRELERRGAMAPALVEGDDTDD